MVHLPTFTIKSTIHVGKYCIPSRSFPRGGVPLDSHDSGGAFAPAPAGNSIFPVPGLVRVMNGGRWTSNSYRGNEERELIHEKMVGQVRWALIFFGILCPFFKGEVFILGSILFWRDSFANMVGWGQGVTSFLRRMQSSGHTHTHTRMHMLWRSMNIILIVTS